MKKVRIQEQGGAPGSATMNPNMPQQNPPGEYPNVLDDITFAENRARRPRPRHSQSEEGPFPSSEERRDTANLRYRQMGFSRGFGLGEQVGWKEGYQLGLQRGAQLATELGFYQGFVHAWITILEHEDPSKQRKLAALKGLLEMTKNFPKQTVADDDMFEKLHKIRAKFKQVVALLELGADQVVGQQSTGGDRGGATTPGHGPPPSGFHQTEPIYSTSMKQQHHGVSGGGGGVGMHHQQQPQHHHHHHHASTQQQQQQHQQQQQQQHPSASAAHHYHQSLQQMQQQQQQQHGTGVYPQGSYRSHTHPPPVSHVGASGGVPSGGRGGVGMMGDPSRPSSKHSEMSF
ncbi:POU domain, class 3, transcription factor 3-B-like [Varroa destructor]|uniref:Essential protein Yae1 N-terminal domain-containing protein n=1 Tax=Varroa destructor TaxID=109461 RepID=A0A7M7JVA4_VARDE|nr:POU domain, class 3, transcription factor 3-B-like [Varroa destructor]